VVKVFLLPSAQRDLDDLKGESLQLVMKKIRLLSEEPRPFGSLKLTAEEGYRIRVGNFRVLYRIDDVAKKVYIYRVKTRKDAYRH